MSFANTLVIYSGTDNENDNFSHLKSKVFFTKKR